MTTNYTYNTDDFRLNRIQTGSLFDKNYTYDAVGNIASIVNNLTSKTESFTYDSLDRLKTASESTGYNYAYEYNPIGNLTKFIDSGVAKDYAYGTKPHALTGLVLGETAPTPATNYSAEYFTNNNLSGSPTLTRTDASINFDWESTSPDASIPNDNFSARWTKTINFEAGKYVFSTTTDDGVRLYIDDVLVINKWQGQSSVMHTAVKDLSAGNHTIKMEYYEGSGGAVARFNYQKLTTDFTGEYFSNKTLSGSPTIVRNDPAINFDWKMGSPSATIPWDNFSTRWTKVASFSAGIYQFTVKGDDGIRLFVDDEQLINGWVDQSSITYTTTKALSAGEHRIRLEYYESGGGAVAQLAYSQVSGPFTAEYFNNQTLSGTPVLTRQEADVNFDWGDYSPDASIQNNQFSARFTKTQSFAAGEYEFTITGDDGIRLYIDDQLVSNGWFDQGSVGYTAKQTLSAGNHTIRVEYYEAWGGAVAKFSMRPTSSNAALNKTTTTSSVENNDPALAGEKAVDASSSSRWSSSFSDPQWIYVDLGSRKTVNRVKLNWEAAFGSEYQIQVSDNAINWTTVKSIGGGNGGIDDITGFYATGRYVRMYGTQRAISAGYSLWEMEVYTDTAPTLPGLEGTQFYVYDANGNLKGEGEWCYEYNEENQLKRVKKCADNQVKVEYVYDYNGLRMVKKNFSGGILSNTVYSWSDSFETKVTGGTTEMTVYYFANNELVAKKDNSGNKTYFHNDHLGSASIVTNQSGGLVEATSYDPWGKIKSGGTQSKFAYTGQEHDGETGLDYYNARYYNSDIRRFTQPDDIIQDPFNPQSLNRYSYVWNNPVKYTDPSGHFVSAILRAVNLAVRVYTAYKAVQPVINQVTTKSQPVVKAADTAVKITNNKASTQNVTKTFSSSSKQAENFMSSNAPNVGNAAGVHGNNLKSTATTWGYTLRDKTTGAIKKFGETINPEGRYSKEWLKTNNLEFKPETFGSKADMRIWEHEQIGSYLFQHGEAPLLNNISRSVNVFR